MTVWDKTVHCTVWMLSVIPWVWLTIHFGFFPTELMLLGKAVLSGPCVAWKPYFWAVLSPSLLLKFPCNDAFFIHMMGNFLFLMHDLKEGLCVWLYLVSSHSTQRQTSYLQIWMIKPTPSANYPALEPVLLYDVRQLHGRLAWVFLLYLLRVV